MRIRNNAKRIRDIDRELEKIRIEMSMLPTGTLWITRNGNSFKYFRKQRDCPPEYIRKGDLYLARDLAFKKYLELKELDLASERDALIFIDQNYISKSNRAEKYLFDNKGAARLLHERFPIADAPLAVWAARPGACDAPYQEERIIECNSGHFVRNKSEGLIDNTLFEHRIPFRYEDPLILGHKIIYPDFTIRHPKTGEYIYWEHFGRVDIPNYRKRWLNALRDYAVFGYYPFQNLITTIETDDMPLDAGQVGIMMEYFFSL